MRSFTPSSSRRSIALGPAHRVALAAVALTVLAALLYPLSSAEAAAGAPIGHLDSMVASGDRVTVTAWAIDRDTPTTPVTVRLYVDGRYHSGHKADRTRNDVARAYPGAGTNHGLSATINIDRTRGHRVCAYAINTTGNSPHTELGCRTIGNATGTPAPAPAPKPPSTGRGAPIGYLDSMIASGNKVTVTAWAIDLDTPTTPVTVRLYLDGKYHSGYKADRTRNDVARARPGTGSNHGLSATVSIDRTRNHQLCAYAINTTGNSPHTALGCRTIGNATTTPTPKPPAPKPPTTSTTRPTGALDPFGTRDGGITATGWAKDPDTTAPITVRVYVDGAWAGAQKADGRRSGTGNGRGFKINVTFKTGGSHRVCVYAIDHNGRAANTTLGCRTVASSPYGPGSTLNVTGRGWGHGRGMGQWGSLGYAVLDGWSTDRILDHFYGNTRAGSVSNPSMRVRIVRASDETIAITTGARSVGIKGLRGSWDAVRVRKVSGNRMQIEVGSGCSGPWKPIGWPVDTPVTITPPNAPGDSASDDLQYCEGYTRRHYRGNLEVSMHSGRTELVNVVKLESYLRGVVPREVPAGWAYEGGGRGAAAVRAQAVAARSYAMAESRSSWFKTCDTTSCQVYGGRGRTDGSGYSSYEHSATNAAIGATSGQVRRFRSNGAIARTEFSSSTGGQTIGGTFPGVPDAGDRIRSNPHHRWTKKIPVSTIEAKYRRGHLLSADVVATDGWGDDGGRATSVRLRFTNGTTTVSATSFRLAFGLKSNWFRT